MRRGLYIVMMLIGTLAMQAQDYSRLAERTIIGTARYVGMSGAMTAIGGDPSAAMDNPAGLGLYRRAEVMLTTDLGIDQTTDAKRLLRVSLAQASAVFSLTTGNEDQGLVACNFMLSYKRHRTFYRNYYLEEGQGNALGHLLGTSGVTMGMAYPTSRLHDQAFFTMREWGSVNEFGFDWAMNYSNMLYAGIGLRLHAYNLTEDANYAETFGVEYLRNTTYVSHSGLAFSGAFGLIYRPTGWLRLGLSVQTPSLGSLNTITKGTTEAMTDSIRTSWSPEIAFSDNDFHLPFRLSTSVAFQIGAWGMVAVQYDYSHAKYQNDIHTFRVGFEVIPVLGLYLNAGYAYENTFAKGGNPTAIDPSFERRDTYSRILHGCHYASAAVGYRGKYMMVQAAYQYRWQKMTQYAHPFMDDAIAATTHRIVLTLGWHQH